MNYIQQTKKALKEKLPDCEDDLLDLYNCLVWLRGEHTTYEDVHDAWAVWRNKTAPKHPSIIAFDDLQDDVQLLDEPYVTAIKEVAKEYNPAPF